MKARVIETGEIVNVTPNPTWYKENGQGTGRREWDEDELEFLNSTKKIISIDEAVEVKNSFTPLDSDFERDAVSFCIDKGLNTTPYIAKTIAKHFFELGLKYANTEITHKK